MVKGLRNTILLRIHGPMQLIHCFFFESYWGKRISKEKGKSEMQDSYIVIGRRKKSDGGRQVVVVGEKPPLLYFWSQCICTERGVRMICGLDSTLQKHISLILLRGCKKIFLQVKSTQYKKLSTNALRFTHCFIFFYVI